MFKRHGLNNELSINVLRDELKDAKESLRSNLTLRWAVSSGLLVTAVSVAGFALSQSSNVRASLFGLCFILFFAMMIVNIYFETLNMLATFRVILAEIIANSLLKNEILIFGQRYSRFGNERILDVGTTKTGIIFLTLGWMIAMSYTFFEFSFVILAGHLHLRWLMAIAVAVILGLYGLSDYRRINKEVDLQLQKSLQKYKE